MPAIEPSWIARMIDTVIQCVALLASVAVALAVAVLLMWVYGRLCDRFSWIPRPRISREGADFIDEFAAKMKEIDGRKDDDGDP